MAFKMKISGAAPGLRISNQRCFDCEHVWERKESVAEQSSLDPISCPECNSVRTDEHVGTVAPPKVIVRGNHDFAERERARLYTRSTEHFRREGRDEAVERDRSELKRAREVVGE